MEVEFTTCLEKTGDPFVYRTSGDLIQPDRFLEAHALSHSLGRFQGAMKKSVEDWIPQLKLYVKVLISTVTRSYQ